MTSQRTRHSAEQPAQGNRTATQDHCYQLPEESSSSTSNPASSSQYFTESGTCSDGEDYNPEADETACYSQQPLSPVAEGQSPHQASSPAPLASQTSLPAPLASQTSLPAPLASQAPAPTVVPAVHEAWWVSLQQEQLVAYTQQQKELFSQLVRVNDSIITCTSAFEREHLIATAQRLAAREYELRYMLEARQAWDSFLRMSEQRFASLSARAQPNP
ncbi:hypothetical protein BGZ96_003402 [Linnemannia gamsii]|uniref:Uncharacterized protein n=1 Tax=Linnemannia gamsii TaxID=64522 RepID=A0ABQ7JJC4_9FUNG|nr:hypothetical protein BGZ96_003402 [Linnemannia gamsii]